MQFNGIPLLRFATLVAIAIAIVIAHWLISRYVIRFVRNEHRQRSLGLYVPLITNIIWILYFLYTFYVLALINPVISIFVFGLILALTWNYVKDFVHGTLFKLQKGNLAGQRIKADGFSGEVIRMRNTKIDLQLENGEIIQYPYSKLSNQAIGISTSVKHQKYFTIQHTVRYKGDPESLKMEVNSSLLNIPWIVSTMNIKTEILERDSEKTVIRINGYTLDEKFILKIQRALELMEFE